MAVFLLGLLGLGAVHRAIAQERHAEGATWEIELGPAAERDLKAKTTSRGFALSLEGEIVEDGLELEFGLTRLAAMGQRELGVDLILKKALPLSPSVDLMIGLGPQASRKLDGQELRTSWGVELSLDVQYWPSDSRSLGWYVEPSYGVGVGGAKGERSFGGSAGVVIRWP